MKYVPSALIIAVSRLSTELDMQARSIFFFLPLEELTLELERMLELKLEATLELTLELEPSAKTGAMVETASPAVRTVARNLFIENVGKEVIQSEKTYMLRHSYRAKCGGPRQLKMTWWAGKDPS